MRRGALAAVVAASVAVPGALTNGAHAASVGETVLPPFRTNTPALPSGTLGSEAGVEWHNDSTGGRFTTDGGHTVHTATIGYISAFIGNDLVSAGEEEDVTTGQVTHLALHQPDQWMGGLGGGGWLEHHPGSADIDRYQTGQGLVASYPPPPVDGAPGASGWIVAVRLDGDGGFFYDEASGHDPSATRASLSYLDFRSGTYTIVGDTAGLWNGVADEDADWLAWCRDSHTLVWAPRMAPTVQRSVVIKGCYGVALSGSNVAIRTTGTGPDGKPRAVVYSGSLLGQLTQLSTTMPVWAPMRAANGEFTLEAGSTAQDAGVYQLTAGSANVGPRIVRWGPAAAAPGHLLATQSRLFTYYAGHVEMRSVRVSGGSASYGGATRVVSGSDVLTADGSRTARLQISRNNVRTVIVQDGARVVGRYGVSPYSFDATLSGHRLVVPHFASYDPNADPWGGASTVIDLSTGRHTTVPRTLALDGNRIAYLTRNGEVRVRDLGTGREQTVRRAGGFDPSCATPTVTTIDVSGSWVLYVIPDCSGKVRDAAAVNLSTGRRVSLTRALAGVFGSNAAVHLAGGFVAWVDNGPFTVHLMDLGGGHDRVIGSALRPSADYFGLTSRYLAWIASDTRRHLLAL